MERENEKMFNFLVYHIRDQRGCVRTNRWRDFLLPEQRKSFDLEIGRKPTSAIEVYIPTARKVEIFYSYADADQESISEFEKQLSSMKEQNLIAGLHSHRIESGTQYQDRVDTHLKTASLILLLISPNYMASTYCY